MSDAVSGCPAGFVINVSLRRRRGECVQLAPGYFSLGPETCAECPAGETTARRGATGADECGETGGRAHTHADATAHA